jgi:hypothetical protein
MLVALAGPVSNRHWPSGAPPCASGWSIHFRRAAMNLLYNFLNQFILLNWCWPSSTSSRRAADRSRWPAISSRRRGRV